MSESVNPINKESSRTASAPWLGERAPHLPCSRGELPSAVLFPGDPARVDRFASVLDDFRVLGQNREYRVGAGRYQGVEIGVCSTGIGGPSTEIALVEAAELGCQYALRIGGTGALKASIPLGSLLIVESALRGGGAAAWYADPTEPAAMHSRMKEALTTCAEARDAQFSIATVRSIDGYYAGQGRRFPYSDASVESILQQYKDESIDALDMETETVLVLGKKLHMIAGSLLAVHANRGTDTWLENFGPAQEQMIAVACDAMRHLVRSKEDFSATK